MVSPPEYELAGGLVSLPPPAYRSIGNRMGLLVSGMRALSQPISAADISKSCHLKLAASGKA